MIAALMTAWQYRRLIALVGGILLLASLGLYIWGLRATIAGQAESLAAKDKRIEAVTGERDIAIDTANQNAAEIKHLTAERDKADAVAAEDAKRSVDRSSFEAKFHKEIANVKAPPGPAPIIGPYTADALRVLRARKAGAASDAHADPGGAHPDSGPASGMPARP